VVVAGSVVLVAGSVVLVVLVGLVMGSLVVPVGASPVLGSLVAGVVLPVEASLVEPPPSSLQAARVISDESRRVLRRSMA
jgi:hypothetical protein